jgi:hypothetical protein
LEDAVIHVVDYNPDEDGPDLTFVFRAGLHAPPMPDPGETRDAYLLRCAREGWFEFAGDLYHLINLP